MDLYAKFEEVSVYDIDYRQYLNIEEGKNNQITITGITTNEEGKPIY
jgi:hypothetical protein